MSKAQPAFDLPTEIDKAAADGTRHALEQAPSDTEALALVSGCHDSLTAMHVAYEAPQVNLTGIVHINTGIGIPQTREFVKERARDLGLEYHEIGGANDGDECHDLRYLSEEYVSLVVKYGFPGPAAHKWMYVNLKEKPLQRFLSERDEPVTLVSGVRKHESKRRMVNVDEDGVQEYLGKTTVSPIVNWTGMDVRRYRRARNLPMNPVVEMLEMSGECLCGAFANRGERRMIRLFFPEVHRYLLCLEAKVSAAAHLEDGPAEKYSQWGHNQFKDHERDAMNDANQMLLCSSCEQQQECSRNGN
ncbi:MULTISPECIES: phosphoadenosine phosphosulfate reductase family protein [unclassified Haloferax]|uniref:phosphoadenosine phosphosulfate reductase family protein n=1 Tax=unclassified Haloferax TaxID=2625095 RepID=UPI002875515F|nr:MULTISPECIES: phosphoadenosine phosphosulfate reductase family protein [unclassified Haloferax]MDS0243094.1 phosphoadenosine phosphosulfate reductase family protein [Haloferax sp. S2CR25]MDS0446215.1 phosphoadenosine phosphosulfate reductase family protein [Haloferax sp. S2CR25-2]